MNCKFKISLRAVALVIAVSLLLNVAISIPKTLAKGNIIEIYNADDLMEQVVLSANGKTFEGDTIRLMNDITLTDADYTNLQTTYASLGLATFTFNIKEKSPFMGEFDGNGKTISNLRYDISGSSASSEADTGLFAFTKGANIHDFIIKDSVIDADYRGGIVAGLAQNTVFNNISVQNSTLTLYCYNVVLTLGSDGGLTGGVLVGKAEHCYIYNCEANGCTVSTNTTSGVEAISGKGMYLGGIVGDLDGGVLEYSRVQDSITRKSDGTIDVQRESLIKIHYDVAVRALGGIRAYAGGLVGEMQNGAFCIDSFSTADMDVYTATYVSVGGGNSGHIGGIAAAVRGSRCEIKRCHFAGEATSKQYNAVLVIPIIQNNKNISGLVAKFDGGSTTNSYFKYELNPDVEMKVLGDDTATSDYGPKNNDTYVNQSFWEGRNYDFSGTIKRENYYDYGSQSEVYDHTNKWVMDYYQGIPVHGNSMAATFDFPNAGTLEIDYTELIGAPNSTTRPLFPATQGFTTMEDTIRIAMQLNKGYKVNAWYYNTDFHETSIANYDDLESLKKTKISEDENHIITNLNVENANATLTITGTIDDKPVIKDNDLFIADVQANVIFNELDGTEIWNEWYDYRDSLPDITYSQCPTSPTAIFVGWTTEADTSDSTPGYEKITSGLLNNIPIYKTGDPIEKPMELYPVFADLITNVKVAIEGHHTSDVTTRTDDGLKVGDVSVGQEVDPETETVRYYVELENFTGEDKGYRFLGWYADTSKTAPDYTGGVNKSLGDSSNKYRYYLDEYDLTQYDSDSNQLLIVAKMEYLVTYRVQEVGGDLSGPYKDEVTYAERWEAYNDNFENIDGPDFVDATFSHWADKNDTKVDSNTKIQKPLTVYEKTNGDGYGAYSITIHSDFPGAASSLDSDGLKDAGWEVSYTIASSDYNFVFWSRERTDSDKGRVLSTSNPFEYSGNLNTTGADILYTAHFTADVDFYGKDGNIKAATTRRYLDKVFISPDQVSAATYTYKYLNGGAQKGSYVHVPAASPSDADMYMQGYYFIGWINKDALTTDEWNYVYDIHSEDAYCTSDINRALPYVMSKEEVCTEPMDLYPVYVKYGSILTDANVDIPEVAEQNGIVNDVTIPDYVIKKLGIKLQPSEFYQSGYNGNNYIDENGNVTITVTAEDNVTQVIPDKEQKYQVKSISVYKDNVLLGELSVGKNVIDGKVVTVTEDTTNLMWSFDYIVEPGHDYKFVANYEPLVLLYHTSANDIHVEIRNPGDLVGEQPRTALNGYVFEDWTDEKPVADNWYSTDTSATMISPEDVVNESKELWPVFKKITIQVNSNIDDEVGDTAHRSATWQSDSVSESVMLSADLIVGEYTFMGWYTGWDVTQTDAVAEASASLLSDKLEYTVSGDVLLTDTVYTAVYKKVFTINYFDTNGNLIDSVYLIDGASRSFVQNISENEESLTVPIDQDAFLNIFDSMEDNQLFKEWYWLREDSSKVTWKDFYKESAVDSMKNAGTRVMNLYPIILEATAKDSKGQNVTVVTQETINIVDGQEVITVNEPDIQFSFHLEESATVLEAYLNFPATDKAGNPVSDKEWYAQPSLLIKVVEKTFKVDGLFDESNIDVDVKLYEDKAISVSGEHIIQTEAIQEQSIVASEGNTTVFYFSGLVTIEKKLTDSDEPFVFYITEYDASTNSYNGERHLVIVKAGSKATIELPCGYYSVTEDKAWAWKYQTSITKDGESVVGETAEVVLSVGKDGSVKTEKDTQTGDIIVIPIEFCFTNERDTSKENWFGAYDYEKNVFNKVEP